MPMTQVLYPSAAKLRARDPAVVAPHPEDGAEDRAAQAPLAEPSLDECSRRAQPSKVELRAVAFLS